MTKQTVNFLKLSLHGRLVGYLTGFQHGKNILSFAPEFYLDSQRPTLSLITHTNFPNADKILKQQWSKNQRLHPLLSNLLPEGALRSLIAQGLKVHVDNEFQLLSYLGRDLPGALLATLVHPDEVPTYVLSSFDGQDIQLTALDKTHLDNRFSLAGVQMKFSMRERDGRFTLTHGNTTNNAVLEELGDWIVKTPSIHHQSVPENEYTVMKLAEMAGVDIPEIQLVEVKKLDKLPSINLPNSNTNFAKYSS